MSHLGANFPGPPPDLTRYITRADHQYVAGGGFGDVYRCWYHDGSPKRGVAVKAFRFTFSIDGDANNRSTKMVRRELGIWRRLNHANVVPFIGIAYGFGMRDAMSLVSLWMRNGSLHHFLEKHADNLSVQHRLKFLLDIADGLCYLHSFPIVHGDLNCNNVLLDADYTARLADFGYASLVGSIPEALTYLQRSTTNPGALRWSPPEQMEPTETFHRTTKSDIYSFGCIALQESCDGHCRQVLSGKLPWSEIREDMAVVLQLARGHKPGRPASRTLNDMHWRFIQQCWLPAKERPVAQVAVYAMMQFLRTPTPPQGKRGEEGDSETSISFVLPLCAPAVGKNHGHSSSAPMPPPRQTIQIPSVYMPSCPSSPSLVPTINQRASYPDRGSSSSSQFDFVTSNTAISRQQYSPSEVLPAANGLYNGKYPVFRPLTDSLLSRSSRDGLAREPSSSITEGSITHVTHSAVGPASVGLSGPPLSVVQGVFAHPTYYHPYLPLSRSSRNGLGTEPSSSSHQASTEGPSTYVASVGPSGPPPSVTQRAIAHYPAASTLHPVESAGQNVPRGTSELQDGAFSQQQAINAASRSLGYETKHPPGWYDVTLGPLGSQAVEASLYGGPGPLNGSWGNHTQMLVGDEFDMSAIPPVQYGPRDDILAPAPSGTFNVGYTPGPYDPMVIEASQHSSDSQNQDVFEQLFNFENMLMAHHGY